MMSASETTKAERLRKFRGAIAAHDRATAAYWRNASPAEHAAAMIELSEYAEEMAALTGLGKNPRESFPGFPRPRARPPEAQSD